MSLKGKPQHNHEAEFYQWVFTNCDWKIYHSQNNRINKPFASYNVYIKWIKQCQ